MKKMLEKIEQETGKKYSAFEHIYSVNSERRIKNIFIGLLCGALLILFVPWTQNINTL
jgi:hypothetical protein